MRCPHCLRPLRSNTTAHRACASCGAPLPEAVSRRVFLLRSGVTGLTVLGAASLLDACAPSSSTSAAAPPTATPNSLGLHWGLANPFGIEMDDRGQVWVAGHVNDVLEGTGTILAAAQSGGVWLITDGGTAYSLSHDWDSPDLNALALGADGPTHVFAGGSSARTGGGALYVSDVTQNAGLLAPWMSVPLGSIGEIYRIVVVPDQRYVVLATSNGLWWSSIPARGSAASAYSWRRATGLPVPDGSFFGLVAGPEHTIVASAWGPDAGRGHYGIFYGSWSGGDLRMTRASIDDLAHSGIDQTQMAATSLTAYVQDRRVMYAVASDTAEFVYAVLWSDTAGREWHKARATLVDASGALVRDPQTQQVVTLRYFASNQGNAWNNCIGMSATDSRTFAIGWRNGPFLTQDGGQTFKAVSEGDGGHQDMHAILFTATDGGRMYVCSDGGIHVGHLASPPTASGQGIAYPFTTLHNRRLANLQFLGPSARQFWGAFGVSYQTAGLVAGGLQDNDNVYSIIGSGGTATPWRHLYSGADGGPVLFPVTGGAIQADIARNLMYGTLNAAGFTDNVTIPIRNAKAGGPSGSTGIMAVIEPVASPLYHNASGQLMYAVAGTGADIYGLFANADGGDIHWDYLASLPITADQGVSAIASGSGNKIFAGVRGNGQIYVFSPASPSAITQSSGLPAAAVNGSISILRIIVQRDESPFDVYAVYDDFSRNPATGGIYHSVDGQHWSPIGAGLPGGPYYCLETDWTANPKTLFLATDDAVYASTSNGSSWFNVSNGLPRRPHCSDLRFVTDPDGAHYLYLATFGWSVWRTRLS